MYHITISVQLSIYILKLYQHTQLKVYVVQLKGNVIPTHVLQLEISHVKITSYVQCLNGGPLRLCPHQANHRTCVPVNVFHSFLNKLFNEI